MVGLHKSIRTMKIEKITEIKSFGIFKDFFWDKQIVDGNNKVKEFNKVNVLYGRNYSGKTTLSRIFRNFEQNKKNVALDSYKINIDGKSYGPNDDLPDGLAIRVYNEDFRAENLSFLDDYNKEGKIQPFAVLGKDNIIIEKKISEIQNELGCSEKNKESGKYKVLAEAKKQYDSAQKDYQMRDNYLQDLKRDFATRGKNSIKEHSDLYGDVRYDIRKLENDINYVRSESYNPIEENQRNKLFSIIKDETKEKIAEIGLIYPEYLKIAEESREVLRYSCKGDERLQFLIQNELLSSWIHQGKQLHEEEHEYCKFCGNAITESRWETICNHFNQKTEQIISGCDALISRIQFLENKLDSLFQNASMMFYSSLRKDIEGLLKIIISEKETVKHVLSDLKRKLSLKKTNVTTSIVYDYVQFDLDNFIKKYNIFANKNNQITDEKRDKFKAAQDELRLDAVAQFLDEINYESLLADIENKSKLANGLKTSYFQINNEVHELIEQQDALRKIMTDERRGASYVNEYIASMECIDLQLQAEDNPVTGIVYFSVYRDGHIARNLSEGERSIISFCYFIAKLKEQSIIDRELILWIDDPISSLDNNHIFGVFSLIHSVAKSNPSICQLFISTHNLDFLKYLKRINFSKHSKLYNEEDGDFASWYLVSRSQSASSLQIMPKYMKNFVTEFEHLFYQIHRCATTNKITDDTYSYFYDFGNNARKFLEIYISFLRPTCLKGGVLNACDIQSIISDPVQAIKVNRICNEMSHLVGGLERSSLIVDFAEITDVARAIMQAVYDHDGEQYASLCKLVKVSPIQF